ncbi:reverse transcriptase domain-containing protein [Tanacetum coccineum]
MRTRSQARRRRQPQVRQTSVESSNLEKPDNPPIVTMDDNRTMAQLLEAPTEGYEDAIVIPEITANNFEIKHGLLNLVQNKQFFGNDKEDPHAHIRYFNKITSTMKIPNVPNTSVKLMLFPFSLEGAARIWLEKEPPRSIETWDDLVSKFINKFFPPSKTTNLRNEITRFQQKFDETFYEAWDRFNDLLRGCPHHGFSELHQLDTFYNALNSNDQDSLNSAAGGNFLDKMPRECLKIIESKSKVRQSRNKAVVAKMSTSSSTQAVSSDVAELKDMVRALILDRKNQTPASAPVKAVEQIAANYNQLNSWLSNSDGLKSIRPPGVPPIQNPMQIVKTISSKEITSIKTEKQFNQGQIYRASGQATSSSSGPALLRQRFLLRSWNSSGNLLPPKGRLKGITTRSECVTYPRTKAVNHDASHALMTMFNEGDDYPSCWQRSGHHINLDHLQDTQLITNHMTVNKIDVIDMACDEYFSRGPRIFNMIAIDFLLIEEADSFLALEDDPTSSEVDPTYQDPEGDILLLEAILNSEPPPPLPNQEQYLPGVRKELKLVNINRLNLR